jgi:hypothetical protein
LDAGVIHRIQTVKIPPPISLLPRRFVLIDVTLLLRHVDCLISAIREDYNFPKARSGSGKNKKPIPPRVRVVASGSEPVRRVNGSEPKTIQTDDLAQLRAYEQTISAERRSELEKRTFSEATDFERRTIDRLGGTNPVLWS